tara:strand:- start:6 stop:422 length:417 start_codon:yes stop_codon:yes gene_type:complete
MVDLGRLKSPLSDPELLNKMIGTLWDIQSLNAQHKTALKNGDLNKFFEAFEQELIKSEDVGEKTRVLDVRLEERLKGVETNLNSYRRKLKNISKKDPSAKEQLEYVESLLKKIRNIKTKIKDEAGRAIRGETKIRHNI